MSDYSKLADEKNDIVLEPPGKHKSAQTSLPKLFKQHEILLIKKFINSNNITENV